MGAPQKIVVTFQGGWLLKRSNPATLRVHGADDMPDRTILAACNPVSFFRLRWVTLRASLLLLYLPVKSGSMLLSFTLDPGLMRKR